jgi:hypothetical protein
MRCFVIVAGLVKREGSSKFMKWLDFFKRVTSLSSADCNAEIEAVFQSLSESALAAEETLSRNSVLRV